MTNGQRNVLIAAGVVAVLMILFPPWETAEEAVIPVAIGATVNDRGSLSFVDGAFAGWSPVFLPVPEYRRRFSMGGTITWPCHVSARVFVAQFFILLLLAGSGWLMLRAGHDPRTVSPRETSDRRASPPERSRAAQDAPASRSAS